MQNIVGGFVQGLRDGLQASDRIALQRRGMARHVQGSHQRILGAACYRIVAFDAVHGHALNVAQERFIGFRFEEGGVHQIGFQFLALMVFNRGTEQVGQ